MAAELDALAAGDIGADDFAEARAVLGTRYEFITNGYFIDSLFDEAYLPDAEVLDRRRQLDALTAIDRGDLVDFIANLVETDNRIEVRNTPG